MGTRKRAVGVSFRRRAGGALVAAILAAPAIAAPPPAGSEALVTVKGIVAPFAVFGLVHNLQQIPGVERVTFNLAHGLADVTIRAGATVTEEQIRAAVHKASYTPGEIRWVAPGAAVRPSGG